jgi:hypothetical protein
MGKVAVSDTILKKPGHFTSEEYVAMHQYTVHGAKLFKYPQSPLDEISLYVVLTHHENWDGTGYPGWIDPFTEKLVRTENLWEKGRRKLACVACCSNSRCL